MSCQQQKSPKMNKPALSHQYTRTFWQLCCHPRLLMQGLAWIGGLALLSNGMVWAQIQALEIPVESVSAIDSLSIPEPTIEPQWTPEPAPTSYESVPEPAWAPEPVLTPEPSWEAEPSWMPEPASAVSAPAPEPVWEPAPTVSAPAPEPVWEAEPSWMPEPSWEPETSGTSAAAFEESAPAPVDAPAPIDSSTYELAPLTTQPEQVSTVEAPPSLENVVRSAAVLANPVDTQVSYNDVYIDPTDYSLGATDSHDLYAEPTEIVVSERSTGCEAVLGRGQSPDSICGGAAPAPRAEPYPAPVVRHYQAPVRSQQVSTWTPTPAPERRSPPIQTWRPSYQSNPQPATNESDPLNIGKIMDAVGIKLGDTTPVGRDYFNPITAARPGNGNTALLFPLSVAAPITSVFGWRTHPIWGDRRFHSGTDIGAPMGTPVVAALAGQVAISEFLGGYGLTVVLEHEEATKETLYGHLSEVFVKPGDKIEQGTVIGRVGSTGFSTGPHLHFELRQLTSRGWVTLNPGAQLEYGLTQLMKSWQTASASPAAQKALHKLEKFANEAIAPEDMTKVKVRR